MLCVEFVKKREDILTDNKKPMVHIVRYCICSNFVPANYPNFIYVKVGRCSNCLRTDEGYFSE